MTVLDTNIVSETMRPDPDASVLRWLSARPLSNFYTTTITQAEILFGLELLPTGKRQAALQRTARLMFDTRFSGRILVFDQDAARAFASISAARRKMGRPIREMDAQIAAIAFAQGAALATRNTRDFEDCGVKLINPWNYSN